MTLRVTIVIGNPKPGSRTRRVAEVLVDKLIDPASSTVEIVELADYANEIFSWPSDKLAALNARVAESDLVVFASPTYKATYTGLLKAFLDRYPANGLAGVVTIPVLTGADETHSMAPNTNLTPLLLELGSVVPGRGLYFVIKNFENLTKIVEAHAREYSSNLALLSLISANTNHHLLQPSNLTPKY